MNTFVLVFHPHLDQSQVNARLAHAARDVEGVTVRDMYALYPDFKINVVEEQRLLEQADRIVLQFPMYWYSTPALLKQWEDDVLAYGWAYGSTGTALHGKELLIAASAGAPAESYTAEGKYGHSVEEVLTPLEITSSFIGTRYMKPFIITGALTVERENLDEYAHRYTDVLKA
ncbi:NAD(P)H-dependent oxidoreductase [Alloscardovia omnicolens]|uniref:NAD(P)H-dependent oxidoreductase n=1 Tax=Alloscardovia omnicolens TaxID=419015 RepID=UPI00254DD587|nr:NAD(P)H-dependent oxidoreductase [Alloscardovia omnicolens]MDK6664143.1 NAD(P)H-dependent oxidoreductase [Alloscardovia omnicolens]MDK7748454.1 NAD(P)H-dependent oxidoreductase [Alloscardovia omnicolens]